MSSVRKTTREVFLATHPVFTLQEFAESRARPGDRAGARNQLKYHISVGRVRSLERGLYATIPTAADAATWQPGPFETAAAVRPDCIFCFHAALELLGAAHGEWNECTVFTARRRRPLTLGNTRIRFFAAPRRLEQKGALEEGLLSFQREGRTVRATGPERTLVEGFRQPHWVGGLEELLQSAAGFGVLDFSLLMRILEAYGEKTLWALVGWFLEHHQERFFPPASLLEVCVRRRPRQPVYVPRNQRGGKLVSRWNLILPGALLRGFEGSGE